jgi:predicted site-specific integrase-resolvase
MKQELMELSAAAQALGQGYFTTRDLVLKGVLRAVKRSGRWHVRREDVERLKRERTEQQQAARA